MEEKIDYEKNPGFGFLPPASRETIIEGFLLKNYPKQTNLLNTVISLVLVIIIFLFFWWFIIPIFLLIFLLNTSVRRQLLADFRLFPAELILSDYPLWLGDECKLTFRRRLRHKRKTKTSGEISISLACVERVQYTKGTDTETEKKIIWQKHLKTATTEIGTDEIFLTCSLPIPAHLPPSFEGKNNQIRWVIIATQNIPGLVHKVYSFFTLSIDPVKDK